ncbi:MAG TPA: MarR family transcriptional regulator [Clostridia bacterium]|nr:MarR family transcriptional regulator [Clostridia bacterium]
MDQKLFHRLLSIFEFKKSYQLRSSGLSYIQLHVLEKIYKEGEMKTLDISRQMDISPSTLIGMLDELESKNLIMRNRQKNDKRVVLVTATDKGKDQVLQHIREDELFLKNLTAGLDEKEEEQLEGLLQKVTGGINDLDDLFRK